jgi:hypothetical protein
MRDVLFIGYFDELYYESFGTGRDMVKDKEVWYEKGRNLIRNSLIG